MSRPRISASGSWVIGKAEPSVILISSAVRSPSIRECSFFIHAMIDWSRSSPAVRTDRLVTMPPERDDGDLGGAAADVDDHVAGRLVDRQPGADRGGHRLLDDVDAPGAGLVAGLLHGPLLHRGDLARYADHQARLGEVAPAVHLLDEEPQHLLARLEVGDDAVLERADRGDVVRGAPDHPLGLVADGEDLAGRGVQRHHGGLVEEHALAAHVDEGVRGAEVDGHVPADDAVRHAVRPPVARPGRGHGPTRARA